MAQGRQGLQHSSGSSSLGNRLLALGTNDILGHHGSVPFVTAPAPACLFSPEGWLFLPLHQDTLTARTVRVTPGSRVGSQATVTTSSVTSVTLQPSAVSSMLGLLPQREEDGVRGRTEPALVQE